MRSTSAEAHPSSHRGRTWSHRSSASSCAATRKSVASPPISLPVHRTPEGLPVGVQLVARHMHESVLLGLAAQLEAARPWAHRHPEVW